MSDPPVTRKKTAENITTIAKTEKHTTLSKAKQHPTPTPVATTTTAATSVAAAVVKIGMQQQQTRKSLKQQQQRSKEQASSSGGSSEGRDNGNNSVSGSSCSGIGTTTSGRAGVSVVRNMTGTLQHQQQQQRTEYNPSSMINDQQELNEIKHLLWGQTIREDVFQRWSQGFVFSDVEPSALVQRQGGPCAVIAPVQAYLLKILIMDMPGQPLSDLTEEKCKSLLIQALCNILRNCRMPRYRLVILQTTKNISSGSDETPDVEKTAEMAATAASTSTTTSKLAPTENAQEIVDIAITGNVDKDKGVGAQAATAATASLTSTNISYALTSDEFHTNLQTLHFERIESVERYYVENFRLLTDDYGVLLFMYSVFLTKGSENVNADLSDTSEPLIHNTYGYGAQALINLMLTGRAVAHVWDNDQDVGGLKLRGISEQSDIGFITLMEQLRYCTVGSFFKNPRYPVWVMGSDTHLTVLFSNEKRLVSPETPSELGRRVFKSYDPEGNNFISTSVLQDVLASLNLVSEPAYVNIMQKRLDPENLGIILLNAFMDEFYPSERRSTPDTFELMHYNGIPGSNESNKVRYYKGSAVLLEGDIKSIYSSNAMITCLQTKWPNIEVNWHDMYTPSLN